MQVKNVVTLCLLGLVAVSNVHAEDKSCKELVGEKRAQMLVQQCIHVSPATHPPCNASNSCNLIIEEIDRGCDILGKDGAKLNYCSFKIEKQATFTGVLIAGGGQDDDGVSVLTDDGRRVWAYCTDNCGEDMFVPEGEEGMTLKPSLLGKNVSVTIAYERNKVGIAGPSEDDMLFFVKNIQFIK
jgi:hypothetical protein